MLGVVVYYPGTMVERYKQVHPGLHFSDDGFGIGMMPTLMPDRRIITYSNKTIVLVEDPKVVLWRLWKRYYSERAAVTFLTSFIEGAQRLNFFYDVWLKVSEAKGIPFVKAPNAAGFATQFKKTFGVEIKGEIGPYPMTMPTWEEQPLNIIAGMCPNWETVNGRC